MILALSIDNDLIKIGLAKGEELAETWSFATPEALTPDEAEMKLRAFFAMTEQREGLNSVRSLDFEGAIIASVVPSLTDAWVSASQRICGNRPLIVGPGLKTGIRMNYNDPSEIGADRIANIAAARLLFKSSFIAIDMGTTTNFSVVDTEGIFCGGIIAPGLRLSAQALTKGAAQLAAVDIKIPSTVIGKNTHEATRSGIIFGELARLDGLIEAIWAELGYQTEVVITGAPAPEIASLSKHVNHVEIDLALKGLVELYRRNRRTLKG